MFFYIVIRTPEYSFHFKGTVGVISCDPPFKEGHALFKPLSEAEFKEFEPRYKYGWFQIKLHSIFQDLSWCSIETGFWQI